MTYRPLIAEKIILQTVSYVSYGKKIYVESITNGKVKSATD